MPTSDLYNVPAAVIAVTSFRPRSILDVGCGFGKYGVLALVIGRAVIITTPGDFNPQGAEFGNEYERHRCLWTAADTPPGYHCLEVPLLSCSLFVLTHDPLPRRQVYPADWTDLLFLRSRRRLRWLGRLGWPLSAAARALNRIIG